MSDRTPETRATTIVTAALERALAGRPLPAPHDRLTGPGGALDSLGLMQLVDALGEECGAPLPDHLIVPARFRTREDVVSLVAEVLAGNDSTAR